MWIIRASQSGLPLSQAFRQPLFTIYRGRWLWLAKIVYWLHKRCGKSSIMILDREGEPADE